MLLNANAEPASRSLAVLLDILSDGWDPGAGDGFTQPAADPRRRIDFVLLSPDLVAIDAQVSGSDASDHRAVVASVVPAQPTSD